MSSSRADVRRLRPSFAGAVLLTAAAFVIIAGGTITTWWVTTSAVVGWLVCLVVTVRLFLRRPRWVLVAPVVLLVAWFVAVVSVAGAVPSA